MNAVILGICILLSPIVSTKSSAASPFAQEQRRKYDEFLNTTCEFEHAALAHFRTELLKDADTRGYIIVYGGRRGPRSEAKAFAARMKFFLVRMRGLEAERVVTLDGGYREKSSTELWIVRRGESAPSPMPTLSRREVKLRGRVQIRGFNCMGPKG